MKIWQKELALPHLYLILILLNRLYEVRNKAVAPGKSQKIIKRRGMIIPDSRVSILSLLDLPKYEQS